MQWFRFTLADQQGVTYTRFGRFMDVAEARQAADEECTLGYGLSVQEVTREPLGELALFVYSTPPPYPQKARPA